MYISSTCALSRPVIFHWATNCGWASLPTRVGTTTDTGTVTSAIRASSQEIQNIIASTPKMVSPETTICDTLCWRLWPRLSMSLVTRLSTSPRGWLSK